jgi:hypothetical protein
LLSRPRVLGGLMGRAPLERLSLILELKVLIENMTRWLLLRMAMNVTSSVEFRSRLLLRLHHISFYDVFY